LTRSWSIISLAGFQNSLANWNPFIFHTFSSFLMVEFVVLSGFYVEGKALGVIGDG
jgi:hypothetical protein